MRRILLNLIIMLSLAVPTLVPAGAAAVNNCPGASSPGGQVLSGIGQDQSKNGGQGNCDSSGVPRLLATVTNILSIIVGAIAVIMIILAGFKYITSGGESGRVTNAKNTLIYALVGVAIAALAQLLVHYVLNQANAIGT